MVAMATSSAGLEVKLDIMGRSEDEKLSYWCYLISSITNIAGDRSKCGQKARLARFVFRVYHLLTN